MTFWLGLGIFITGVVVGGGFLAWLTLKKDEEVDPWGTE